MSGYASGIGPYIEKLYDYRRTLGYSMSTHQSLLLGFDRFCAANYPDEDNLSEQMVMDWISGEGGRVYEKCLAVRLLGKYMYAVGKEAYILPEKYVTPKRCFAPYIFTDAELSRLFSAIDQTEATGREPYLHEIAPVLFRLIYTCGLRPNEGRQLLCRNVSLDTGEMDCNA